MKPYPDTRTEDACDVLSGVSFADPYRWLEGDGEEVRRWQRAQADLATSYVRDWPYFTQLRDRIEYFSTERYVAVPRYAGGLWFRARFAAGATQAQAVVSEDPMGEGRVLFDPLEEHPSRPPYLSWLSPSPNGGTLAIGICDDGSERNTIRLIDVSSRRMLRAPPPQPLMDSWTGGAQWLPDSSGFFFTAMSGPASDFDQVVYLHQRVPLPRTIRVPINWLGPRHYRGVFVSSDGRHAVAMERHYNPVPVAVARIEGDVPEWRPFVTRVDGTLAGHVVGQRFIGVTNVGARRGRVVAIDLNATEPNDSACWQELVPESDAVLRTITPVGKTLYLTEIVGTYARVRIFDHHGTPLGEVPLRARGAISELPFPLMNLAPKGHPERFLFGFSTLTASPGTYSHAPGDSDVETLLPPSAVLEGAEIEDRFAISADGTRVPYHVVRRTDMPRHQSLPTLIYGYGGFNNAFVPRFPGPMAAFVEWGGVFVHAHLRGGGELGLDWWEGGRLRNKQNGYEDLYAIAEDLIALGDCTPGTLGVTGGSNGGLMAGVAMTQRPELWKVVAPRIPFLDLIGACREPYGKQAILDEMADVEDAREVRRLARFSPYHLVRDDVCYPAVFLNAGDTDPRCPAWHARKFAARLQRASGAAAPVLLHVWENVGHGLATDRSVAILQSTEWLAFTLRHLGMAPVRKMDTVDATHSD